LREALNGNNGSWTNSDDQKTYKHTVLSEGHTPPLLKKGAMYKYKDVDDEIQVRGTGQHVYAFDHKYRPVCYANARINEERTLQERVVVATPEPDPKYMSKYLKFVKKNFPEFMNYQVKKIRSVPWSEYIERSNASPSVKVQLNDVMKWLLQNGYSEDSKLSLSQVKDFVRRSLFLKKENLNYRTPFGRKRKAGRAIQGAPPAFIALMGPWIMALQDHFKKVWTKDNWLVFACGITSTDAAAVLNQWWRLVEDDIGTFDSSVSLDLCLLEVWVSKQFSCPFALIQLMLANSNTNGYTFHGAKYKFPGGRKSGDPYTTLFNSMQNAFMHSFIICDALGWTLKQLKSNVCMLVAGDDNAMSINTIETIDFVASMLKLGFKSEAMYRDSIHEIEFCSCRIYFIDGKPIFGPMPGKVLSKFGFINNPPINVTRESLLKGIALGLKATCYYLPPIRVVVDRVLQLTSGSQAYFSSDKEINIQRKGDWNLRLEVDYQPKFEPDIMCSLQNTYGWTVTSQKIFASTVANWKLDDFVDSPLLDMLCDRDTAGPSVSTA